MEGFKAPAVENEEYIDNGLGVLFRNKRLHHGSPVYDITELRPAVETTIGEGVYFTSSKKDALGYATRRSRTREGAHSTVYSADIHNLKLCDLRNDTNIASILPGFLDLLKSKRDNPELPWHQHAALDEKIKVLSGGTVTAANIRDAASYGFFSEYIRSLGYDGLIAIEGGEGEDIGNHDTFLIFDPAHVENLSVEPD